MGISTQDDELAARFDPVVGGRKVANYLRVLTLEAQTLARACGKSHVHNLEPEDLVALTVEAAAMARVPLAGTDWIPGQRSTPELRAGALPGYVELCGGIDLHVGRSSPSAPERICRPGHLRAASRSIRPPRPSEPPLVERRPWEAFHCAGTALAPCRHTAPDHRSSSSRRSRRARRHRSTRSGSRPHVSIGASGVRAFVGTSIVRQREAHLPARVFPTTARSEEQSRREQHDSERSARAEFTTRLYGPGSG